MSKHYSNAAGVFTPWNKGRLIGQKPPLKLKEIWAIRIRLQFAGRLRVNDISHGATVAARAISVRVDGSDPRFGFEMDCTRRAPRRSLPVSQSNGDGGTFVDSSVFACGRRLD